MNFELTASMMCANYGNLEKEVRDLEQGGIDSFHIDIMDGRYVPNFAMSLNDMRYIAGATKKPLDVHLMIEHPNNHINLFFMISSKRIKSSLVVILKFLSSPGIIRIFIPARMAGSVDPFICRIRSGNKDWLAR